MAKNFEFKEIINEKNKNKYISVEPADRRGRVNDKLFSMFYGK